MTAVLDRYHALLASGELQPDADQAHAAGVLDRLARRLAESAQPNLWERLTGKTPII